MEKTIFARKLRQNQTDVEQLLWKHLRGRRLDGIKFRRQHPIGPYVVDFVCLDKQLVIELDGGQHNTEEGKKKDKERVFWLKQNDYEVLRFWNNEVKTDLDNVLQVIHNALTPHHNPLPKGEEK